MKEWFNEMRHNGYFMRYLLFVIGIGLVSLGFVVKLRSKKVSDEDKQSLRNYGMAGIYIGVSLFICAEIIKTFDLNLSGGRVFPLLGLVTFTLFIVVQGIRKLLRKK